VRRPEPLVRIRGSAVAGARTLDQARSDEEDDDEGPSTPGGSFVEEEEDDDDDDDASTLGGSFVDDDSFDSDDDDDDDDDDSAEDGVPHQALDVSGIWARGQSTAALAANPRPTPRLPGPGRPTELQVLPGTYEGAGGGRILLPCVAPRSEHERTNLWHTRCRSSAWAWTAIHLMECGAPDWASLPSDVSDTTWWDARIRAANIPGYPCAASVHQAAEQCLEARDAGHGQLVVQFCAMLRRYGDSVGLCHMLLAHRGFVDKLIAATRTRSSALHGAAWLLPLVLATSGQETLPETTCSARTAIRLVWDSHGSAYFDAVVDVLVRESPAGPAPNDVRVAALTVVTAMLRSVGSCQARSRCIQNVYSRKDFGSMLMERMRGDGSKPCARCASPIGCHWDVTVASAFALHAWVDVCRECPSTEGGLVLIDMLQDLTNMYHGSCFPGKDTAAFHKASVHARGVGALLYIHGACHLAGCTFLKKPWEKKIVHAANMVHDSVLTAAAAFGIKAVFQAALPQVGSVTAQLPAVRGLPPWNLPSTPVSSTRPLAASVLAFWPCVLVIVSKWLRGRAGAPAQEPPADAAGLPGDTTEGVAVPGAPETAAARRVPHVARDVVNGTPAHKKANVDRDDADCKQETGGWEGSARHDDDGPWAYRDGEAEVLEAAAALVGWIVHRHDPSCVEEDKACGQGPPDDGRSTLVAAIPACDGFLAPASDILKWMACAAEWQATVTPEVWGPLESKLAPWLVHTHNNVQLQTLKAKANPWDTDATEDGGGDGLDDDQPWLPCSPKLPDTLRGSLAYMKAIAAMNAPNRKGFLSRVTRCPAARRNKKQLWEPDDSEPPYEFVEPFQAYLARILQGAMSSYSSFVKTAVEGGHTATSAGRGPGETGGGGGVNAVVGEACAHSTPCPLDASCAQSLYTLRWVVDVPLSATFLEEMASACVPAMLCPSSHPRAYATMRALFSGQDPEIKALWRLWILPMALRYTWGNPGSPVTVADSPYVCALKRALEGGFGTGGVMPGRFARCPSSFQCAVVAAVTTEISCFPSGMPEQGTFVLALAAMRTSSTVSWLLIYAGMWACRDYEHGFSPLHPDSQQGRAAFHAALHHVLMRQGEPINDVADFVTLATMAILFPALRFPVTPEVLERFQSVAERLRQGYEEPGADPARLIAAGFLLLASRPVFLRGAGVSMAPWDGGRRRQGAGMSAAEENHFYNPRVLARLMALAADPEPEARSVPWALRAAALHQLAEVVPWMAGSHSNAAALLTAVVPGFLDATRALAFTVVSCDQDPGARCVSCCARLPNASADRCCLRVATFYAWLKEDPWPGLRPYTPQEQAILANAQIPHDVAVGLALIQLGFSEPQDSAVVWGTARRARRFQDLPAVAASRHACRRATVICVRKWLQTTGNRRLSALHAATEEVLRCLPMGDASACPIDPDDGPPSAPDTAPPLHTERPCTPACSPDGASVDAPALLVADMCLTDLAAAVRAQYWRRDWPGKSLVPDDRGVRLRCGHTWHAGCLRSWILSRGLCHAQCFCKQGVIGIETAQGNTSA
jgi:hypothetical protein